VPQPLNIHIAHELILCKETSSKVCYPEPDEKRVVILSDEGDKTSAHRIGVRGIVPG